MCFFFGTAQQTSQCSISTTKNSIKTYRARQFICTCITQHGLNRYSFRFSHKALKWELPLNMGDLEAVIHLTQPESAAELEDHLGVPRYGLPLEGFDRYGHWGLNNMQPTDDRNGKFWARHAPVLEF